MTTPEKLYREAFKRERLTTAYGDNSQEINFCDILTGDAIGSTKYFTGKTEVFTNAILLGYFHDKQSDKRPRDPFNRLATVSNPYHASMLKMVFLEVASRSENAGKDAHEIFLEFCKYADGGIEILLDNYNTNNNKLKMDDIFEDVKLKIAEKSAAILNVLNAGN